MPLDPHVRRFLDMMALGGAEKPGVGARRESLRALSRLAADAPVDVAAKDLAMEGPGGQIALRLYRPERSTGGGLVFFHGGGLVTGDLDTHDGICRQLAAASRCRVVAVDYRLAPEHPFPAALEDALAATTWVVEHAMSLGIDPGRLAVGGESAGAGLAALVCQRLPASGPRIAAQLLLCPVLDVFGTSASRREYASGYFLDEATVQQDIALCGMLPAQEDLSPLSASDLAGLPPALIHTAEFDIMRDDGAAYAERLRRAGVAASYVCHAGMIHFFYGLGRLVPRSRPILEAIGADLAHSLQGRSSAAA